MSYRILNGVVTVGTVETDTKIVASVRVNEQGEILLFCDLAAFTVEQARDVGKLLKRAAKLQPAIKGGFDDGHARMHRLTGELEETLIEIVEYTK